MNEIEKIRMNIKFFNFDGFSLFQTVDIWYYLVRFESVFKFGASEKNRLLMIEWIVPYFES